MFSKSSGIMRTIQGQAWDELSRAAYGTEFMAGDVVAANQDEADALLLSGGLSVSVPKRPAVTTFVRPPWQRAE